MSGNNGLDFTSLDYRMLTPQQWEVVRREVLRRAHLERAEALRALSGLFRSGLQRIAAVLRDGAGRAAVRAAAVVGGWWRARSERRQRRRDIAALQAFSDLELKDIGVRRSEIDWVVHHGREHARSPVDGLRTLRPGPGCAVTTPRQDERAQEKTPAAA